MTTFTMPNTDPLARLIAYERDHAIAPELAGIIMDMVGERARREWESGGGPDQSGALST